MRQCARSGPPWCGPTRMPRAPAMTQSTSTSPATQRASHDDAAAADDGLGGCLQVARRDRKGACTISGLFELAPFPYTFCDRSSSWPGTRYCGTARSCASRTRHRRFSWPEARTNPRDCAANPKTSSRSGELRACPAICHPCQTRTTTTSSTAYWTPKAPSALRSSEV
jgi:hypothetical protein